MRRAVTRNAPLSEAIKIVSFENILDMVHVLGNIRKKIIFILCTSPMEPGWRSRCSDYAPHWKILCSTPGRGNSFVSYLKPSTETVGPNQPPIQRTPWALSWGYNSRDVNFTAHLRPVPRLRTNVATLLLRLYTSTESTGTALPFSRDLYLLVLSC